MDGTGIAERLTQSDHVHEPSAWTPDGKVLAFVENHATTEVYVQPFPGPGRRVRISRDGGSSAAWRGDGKELYYVEQRVVEVQGGDWYAAPSPRAAVWLVSASRLVYRGGTPADRGANERPLLPADDAADARAGTRGAADDHRGLAP